MRLEIAKETQTKETKAKVKSPQEKVILVAVLVIDRKTRMYLESSVMADWFLARTVVSEEFKAAASDIVLPSHDLIEAFLSQRQLAHCCTSEWALAETVSVIRRARIELSLFLDVVPLRFYERLKDTPRYALSQSQTDQINEQLGNFRARAETTKGIKILRTSAKESEIAPHVTSFGLDVEDALHLAIAKRFRCGIFVTRDNDFLNKKKRIGKSASITVATPAHVVYSMKAKSHEA